MAQIQTRLCPSCGGDISSGASFCRHCGNKIADATVGKDTKKTKTTTVVIVVIVLALVGSFSYQFIFYLPGGAHPVIAEQPTLAPSTIPSGGHYDQISVDATQMGDNLIVPLAVVEENKIVGFEYVDGTVTVPLLAFISSEGRLVTSFRMCEPCNSKKFSIDGERLSCGNCTTQWSLKTLEGLQGNCMKYPPDPLPSTIENGMIVLKVADILNWNIRL